MTRFADLGLKPELLKSIAAQGYDTPTPIQTQAIPYLLDDRDLLGIAQTGTGKTAAFALPTLDYLLEHNEPPRRGSTRVLVLAPTRELASQIAASFELYAGDMACVVQTIFGGVKIGGQIRALRSGAHIIVATPGRLLDLVEQKALTLGDVEILILDEADQMLDMGFIHDLKKIVAKIPKDRQTLLFSATMPTAIADFAGSLLKNPVRVSVAPESTTAERVDQGVIHVSNSDKPALLDAVLRDPKIDRALVFTRTKHGADKVVRKLLAQGHKAAAIHGNKSQPQRMKALEAFKAGETPILVATDIAARGIDIDGISHVINFEMPNVPEQYVHRIGRTARAGREGLAVSFVAEDERWFLREIEKTTRQSIDVLPMPEGCGVAALAAPDPNERLLKPKGPAGGGGRGARSGGGGGAGRSQGGQNRGRSGAPKQAQSGNRGGKSGRPGGSGGRSKARAGRPA